ncbi:MAG: zinc ribbon domain-containing protein [Deltaproteobacteria bacterium]|nr:zinc ribbon domain-containing protein [Deltaproteobacteria bacterium]
MPIYEYRCKSCSKHFETMQKVSDKPVKECIYCSSKKIEKLISQSSFALKGSGWHKTDYANTKHGTDKTCDIKNSDKQPSCANCPSAN